jgi:hypothetical protein
MGRNLPQRRSGAEAHRRGEIREQRGRELWRAESIGYGGRYFTGGCRREACVLRQRHADPESGG